MVEILAILPAMLLIICATIQFALIYHAKITLNYAVFEAARAGTMNNAQFEPVLEGFARGLAPLYSYDPDDTDQVGAFQTARDKVLGENPDFIRIERLSPSKKDFSTFAEIDSIPNDNLRFRSSSPDQITNRTLQDANLLHLRVTYCYPLYVPGVNALISGVACSIGWCGNDQSDNPSPRIPLTSTAVMRMQSPAKPSNGYYQR